MPLPKPKPTESRDQFLSRCMADETSMTEYPDSEQRFAVCNSLFEQKSILTKQSERKISRLFERQINIAEKKNFKTVFNYYDTNFKKGIEFYRQDQNPLNNNFNTLFTINEMTEMFKKLYRDTGLRFYMWYRKNFNMFIQKLNSSEIERLIMRIEENQRISRRDLENLESTILEGMDRYAVQRTNYLVTAKEVTSISGVARNTLKKVLRDLTAKEEFMSLGLDARVREISKVLKFKSRWMARRVVNTETTAAANNAISLSAQDAFGADNLLKKWITGGANIRDTHAKANVFYGKNPIPENKPYAVGNSFLMFPGDTQLGAAASEIVNCKCVSFPIIKQD
tara:strand:+ start:117 stop:1133 length:1017 start_codon:yes stop_codon:yes gene_type:complete